MHIYDKRFRYTKAIDTDIRKTFERERKRQRAAQGSAQKPESVVPFVRGGAKKEGGGT